MTENDFSKESTHQEIERKALEENQENTLQKKLELFQENLEKTQSRISKIEISKSRPQIKSNVYDHDGMIHQNMFMNYIRKGADQELNQFEEKSISLEQTSGFSVPDHLYANIISSINHESSFRNLASTITISTDSVDLLVNQDDAQAGWIADANFQVEKDMPDLMKIKIPVHEIYAKPRATQKLLDDLSINLEEWLIEKVADKISEVENGSFLLGDGIGKPRGILSYPTVSEKDWKWGCFEEIKTNVDGGFDPINGADALVDTLSALKTTYHKNAVWLMSRSAFAAIRKMKDGLSGANLWQPSMAEKTPSTLLGYPVYISDAMPALIFGKSSKSIFFGSLKDAYQIVDRQGIQVLRDPYSAKPYVEFYTTKRVGGDVINFEAIKIINAKA